MPVSSLQSAATEAISNPLVDRVASSVADWSIHALLWGGLGLLLGLVLGIVCCVLLYRRNLLKRLPMLWNGLSKLFYPLVLCAFMLVGGAAGVAESLHRDVRALFDQAVLPMVTGQLPAVRARIGQELAPMSRDAQVTVRSLVEPIAAAYYYHPTDDSFTERMKARVTNEIVLQVTAQALQYALERAVQKYLAPLVGDDSAAQAQTTQFAVGALAKVMAGTAENVDVRELDRSIGEALAHAVDKQIDSFFKGVLKGLAIKLLLVTLVLVIEIALYRMWIKRRQANPVVTTQAAASRV